MTAAPAPASPHAEDALTGRSSAEDWLQLAIRILIEEGIGEVKVQSIARRLDVSRSSFYWFFKSLSDLHDQLLDHWLRKNTLPIIERAEKSAPDVTTAILNIFECWVDSDLFDPKLDMAVRIWARNDDAVRTVVRRADDQRLDAVTAMFIRYGYPPEEAKVRARVLYFTQIGQYTLELDEPMAVRHRTVMPYLKAFSGVEPTPAHVARLEAYMTARGIAF